jgi:sugar lactone lactonase YvrE
MKLQLFLSGTALHTPNKEPLPRNKKRVSSVAALLITGLLASSFVGTGSAQAFAPGDTAPTKTMNLSLNASYSVPYGLAFDSIGQLYVSYVTDAGESAVSVFASDWAAGSPTPVKTLTGASTGLNRPYAIAFDSMGQMYVTNNDDPSSVTVYASNWADGNTAPIKTLQGGRTGLSRPYGIAFDSTGIMYVSNYGVGARSVTAYSANWANGDTPPIKTLTSVSYPFGIAFDDEDRMYVVDNGQSQIEVYESNWADGNTAPIKTLQLSFNEERAITFDSSGNMYIAGGGGSWEGSAIVHMFSADWLQDPDPQPLKTLAGWNTSLSSPFGVAVDQANNLFVANTFSFGTNSVTMHGVATDSEGGSPGNSRTSNYFIAEGFDKGKSKLKKSMRAFIAKELNTQSGEVRAVCTGTVRGKKWTARKERLALARAASGCNYVTRLSPGLPVELKKRLIPKRNGDPLTVRIRVFY